MHTGKKNHGEGLVWEKGITQRQANLFFIRVKDNRETQLVGPQLKFEMEVFLIHLINYGNIPIFLQ